MPFNVLLLPLLGGYVFISRWNRSRFDARRYSGERLLLHSALAGVWFLLIAFVLTRLAILFEPATYTWWRDLVPFEYTGTSFLAFLLGTTAWYPLNHFQDREEEALKAVEKWGDDLEMLLVRSHKMLRTVSGYRDRETRELVVTHDYAEVCQRLMKDESVDLMAHADDFQLVIPISEVVTANLFDPDVYEMFQREPTA